MPSRNARKCVASFWNIVMQSDEKKTIFSTRIMKVCCIKSPLMGPTPNFVVTGEKHEVDIGDLYFVYWDRVHTQHRPWGCLFSVCSSVPFYYSMILKSWFRRLSTYYLDHTFVQNHMVAQIKKFGAQGKIWFSPLCEKYSEAFKRKTK